VTNSAGKGKIRYAYWLKKAGSPWIGVGLYYGGYLDSLRLDFPDPADYLNVIVSE